MLLETLASTALTSLVNAIKNSEGGKQAAKEMSTAIWEWVRPIFLKDEEPIEDLKKDPNNQLTKTLVQAKIHRYLEKNPAEAEQLKKLLAAHKVEGATQIIQHHSGSGDNVGGDKTVYANKGN